MTILGNIIDEFLDKDRFERSAGTYSFDAHQSVYINDISEDEYYFRIRREATDKSSGIIDIDFRDFQVKDIFSIEKATNATYAKQKYGSIRTYEASLSISVQDPGSTILLYRPSKLGKSALWSHVVEVDSEAIRLSCNPKISLMELYQTTLYKIKTSYISEKKDSFTDKTTEKTNISAQVSHVGLNYGADHEQGSGTDILERYSELPINADIVGGELSQRNMVLVFENYHRLNKNVLEELCYDLRTFSDHNVTTILAGIPDDPFEIIKINNELSGRTTFLPFDFWDKRDLMKIAIGGAQALNVAFSDETLELITSEAAGSPLLMQLYCLLACLSSGITEAQRGEGIPPEVSINKETFEMAMRTYVKQILEPCGLICDSLQNACKKFTSLPDNFAIKISNF